MDNATSAKARLVYPLNGDASGTCTFNGRTFRTGEPLLTLPLNSVNTWTVAGVQGHPLHLHVNPMQIVSFDGATRKFQERSHGELPQASRAPLQCDNEFGMVCVGDWVDTLMLPNGDGHTARAIVRWSATDFVGNVVLHCHYLPHEDQGCLTYVQIR